MNPDPLLDSPARMKFLHRFRRYSGSGAVDSTRGFWWSRVNDDSVFTLVYGDHIESMIQLMPHLGLTRVTTNGEDFRAGDHRTHAVSLIVQTDAPNEFASSRRGHVFIDCEHADEDQFKMLEHLEAILILSTS